jgi:hypothetical protein
VPQGADRVGGAILATVQHVQAVAQREGFPAIARVAARRAVEIRQFLEVCTPDMSLPSPSAYCRRSMVMKGIVKLTADRKNTFHSAGISSGSEALTSHLGI